MRSQIVDEVLGIGEIENTAAIEVLYWVGCAAAVDPRLQKVARALVRVMNRAGVRFAVLGQEERCSGDVARRTGNEFHFRTLARENIETLRRYSVKRIVSHCPHCVHALRNEYPALGGSYDVVHHSRFVLDLIESGRLPVNAKLARTLTYHDPCYLGRYGRDFDSPRSVLDRLGAPRREMKRARERSFCCGAGGGHAFFEDEDDGNVNHNRAREAIATGATTICTACPFCLSMLEDGVRSVAPSSGVEVRDLVEVVDEMLHQADSSAGVTALPVLPRGGVDHT
jgi:Fe-S oxidoreductase